MVSKPTRSGNHHIMSPFQVLALLDGCPDPRHHHIPQPHRLAHAPEGVPDLVGQLPGMCQGLSLHYWNSKSQSVVLLCPYYTVPPS